MGWRATVPDGNAQKGHALETYARLMQELTDASVAAAGAGEAVFERLQKRIGRLGI